MRHRTIPRAARSARAALVGLAVVLGFAASLCAADVRLVKDVPYKSDAASEAEQARCKLDLYLPDGARGFATIVWFHGGGLQGGDKGSAATPGRRFAQDGVAVAAVNYRLSPAAKYPAYIDDAAAAFAFVRRTIAEHGGAPDRVFVSGHSAGGYLAAMIGLDPRHLAPHGLKPTDVAGLIPVSGQMITHSTVRLERDIPRTRPIIDEAAPAYHVAKDVAPTLVFAGSKDLPTRAEENRYFVAALNAAGHTDATYVEVEGRDHGTIASHLGRADDVVARTILDFVRRERRRDTP